MKALYTSLSTTSRQKKKTQDIDDLNYMINKFDLINRNLKFQNIYIRQERLKTNDVSFPFMKL